MGGRLDGRVIGWVREWASEGGWAGGRVEWVVATHATRGREPGEPSDCKHQPASDKHGQHTNRDMRTWVAWLEQVRGKWSISVEIAVRARVAFVLPADRSEIPRDLAGAGVPALDSGPPAVPEVERWW